MQYAHMYTYALMRDTHMYLHHVNFAYARMQTFIQLLQHDVVESKQACRDENIGGKKERKGSVIQS